jgi:hypothetical protein
VDEFATEGKIEREVTADNVVEEYYNLQPTEILKGRLQRIPL